MPHQFSLNQIVRKPAVTSKGGIVASQSRRAAEVGAQVLAAGGEANVNGAAAAGGGGEGGYSRKRFTVASGQTGTCIIGAGGSPVTAAQNGNNGGTTSFTYNGVTLTANGGQGALSAATGGTGGLGGTATGGDINVQGAPGQGGTQPGFPCQSGNGGCSWPIGTAGRGGFINAAASALSGKNGAGGGGANGGYGAYAYSGSGGDGVIVITEYK